MIVQIIGLPGAGKTALAKELKERINAIHLNADEVRSTINSDLGFSSKDRVEQSRRLGKMARLISNQGFDVVVDFVCPTGETREAFGKPDILIWVDRIEVSRFEDTNAIWETPLGSVDLHIPLGMTIEQEVQYVIDSFQLFDWKKPTTLMLGRYQPWHEGHKALYGEALKRTAQVVIGVRDTQGTSEKDPFNFGQVYNFIAPDAEIDTLIMKLPNITNIVYGRDVGYKIEKIELGPDLEAISATEKRKQLGL
jgi:hypothetical protein